MRRIVCAPVALKVTVATLALIAASHIHTPKFLIWNASPSMDQGLYWITSQSDFERGEIVAAEPPTNVAIMMGQRGYLPAGLPLIKRIVAMDGDTFCRIGNAISADGQPVAEARDHDRMRRPLPVWQGCTALKEDEVFLLGDSPESFDSRYFGPVSRTQIWGRAVPIWTWERD